MKLSNQIENDQKNRSLWRFVSWILKLLTPFRVAIGVGCLAMSLLIMYSLLVNNLDRLLHSECRLRCGFILDQGPQFFNPLDWLLKTLSSHHERFYSIQLFLDTTFFVLILVYTYVCMLYGIIKIGINFFTLEIFKIKRRDTMP
mmetsp:Transcript_5774/g.9192  ORF Transcript_5774/g.9192 Transcript_5774/m.9192 type:complete len:144 (+) Transcript_5774:1628-2059(+)